MANDPTSYPRARDLTPSARAQREEYWRRVLARQRQSGLSMTAFANREQIGLSTLSWWSHELRKRDGQPAKGASKPKICRSAFVPVRVVEAMPANGTGLEVLTRDGHVIRLKPGFDPATLRRAIAALEDQPC